MPPPELDPELVDDEEEDVDDEVEVSPGHFVGGAPQKSVPYVLRVHEPAPAYSHSRPIGSPGRFVQATRHFGEQPLQIEMQAMTSPHPFEQSVAQRSAARSHEDVDELPLLVPVLVDPLPPLEHAVTSIRPASQPIVVVRFTVRPSHDDASRFDSQFLRWTSASTGW